MRYYFLLSVLLLPLPVFAQTPDTIEYDRCEYEMIHQNMYSPFYYHIQHDPAVAQSFKSRHDDNPTAPPPFQRTPEGLDPNSATWFDFGVNQNVTATYEFQLDLEYASVLEKPRPIIIQAFSLNNLVYERKIYQDEQIGCVALKVHVSPPPHQFTPDEIAQIAGNEVVGITKRYADEINANTRTIKGYENSNIAAYTVVGGAMLYLVFHTNRLRKNAKLAEKEAERRINMFNVAVTKMNVANQFTELRLNTIEHNTTKMIQSIVGNFGHIKNDLDDAVIQMKKNVSILLSDMRKELEMITPPPEEPEVKTVEIKQDIQPTIEVPDEHGFGFDLESIKNMVDPRELFNRGKDQNVSDFDKFKKDCEKKSIDELGELFTDYCKKANDDLPKIGQGENYQKSVFLKELINSKTMDLEGKK